MNAGQVSQWRNFDLESGGTQPAQNRILLLEGSPVIGAFLASRLIGQGSHVIGPFLNAPEALTALQHDDPTAALIDADIAHKRGHGELLAVLAQRKVPTVLTTGERVETTRSRFPAWALVGKPLAGRQVQDILLRLVAA